MSDAKWVQTSTRPVVMGSRHVVSAGHYLAALAGLRILDAGGNAFDAGVAAGLCINVTQHDLTSVGGVAPICLYRADTGQVETISGLGWWPRAADPRVFEERYGGDIPKGVLRCVMPAAIDAWLTALERHGTMTFAEVAAPAIDLAENGFPMHPVMFETLSEPATLRALRSWPSTSAVFLRDGVPIPIGEPVVQKDLGRMLGMLAEAERGAATREDGIRAARDRFYRGDIAERIARFVADEGGWMTREDLAEFHVGVEPPVTTSYRGFDVYACGPWCQGPVVPETLNILEGYDVAGAEPGGAEVAHMVLESLKASFADRDRFYGDPRFVEVPVDGLLSKAYAEEWRRRIDLRHASPGMPEPGNAWRYSGAAEPGPSAWRYPAAVAGPGEPDTSYLCVVDGDGNAFSATPSDGLPNAPLVPGLGFVISPRGTQSWLDPTHPACLVPGKRPRLTPNPGMVLEDGRAVMPYGTPGLDVQPQAMVQFLVNVIDFGMDVQQAVEAPRFATYSFPASSHPHPYTPGRVAIEGRAGPDVVRRLGELGHRVDVWPERTGTAGSLGAIRVDHATGTRYGAADNRRIAYAVGR